MMVSGTALCCTIALKTFRARSGCLPFSQALTMALKVIALAVAVVVTVAAAVAVAVPVPVADAAAVF